MDESKNLAAWVGKVEDKGLRKYLGMMYLGEGHTKEFVESEREEWRELNRRQEWNKEESEFKGNLERSKIAQRNRGVDGIKIMRQMIKMKELEEKK